MEITPESKYAKIQMLHSEATISTDFDVQQTARDLAENLCQYPWFRFVGIGSEDDEDILIVYVNKRKLAFINSFVPKTFNGIPVVARHVEQPIPATTAFTVLPVGASPFH